MENLNKILLTLLVLLLLCGCNHQFLFPITSYDVDPVYEDHPHTTEIYYNGIDIYFGYYSGLYYYYGVPHFYPWWYYYQFIPPYHYYVHSHVHIHCNNGYYVYGHKGPTINNNIQKDFNPTTINRKVKSNRDRSFVFPRDWKSNNSTKTNKQNYNIDKTNYNRTFNYNNKINKGNNGSTRPNKTNTSRKTKR